MQVQEEVKIYPKVTKVLMGSLVFGLLGIGFVYAGLTSDDPMIILAIIGIFCVLFFGIGLVFSLSKLLQRKPALLINDEGIIDNSSYVSGGEVFWEEIKGIDIYQVMNERFIGIEVHHPEKFLSRHPGWKQKLMGMNKGMTNATIHISGSGLQCNLNELFLVLYRRWKISKSNLSHETPEERML